MVPGPWQLATSFLVFALFGSVLAFVEGPCEDKLFCFRRSLQRDEKLNSRRIRESVPQDSREDFPRREYRDQQKRFNIENVWREDQTNGDRLNRRVELLRSEVERFRQDLGRSRHFERELRRDELLSRRNRNSYERSDRGREYGDQQRVRFEREDSTVRRINRQDRRSEGYSERDHRFAGNRDEINRMERAQLSTRRDERRENADRLHSEMNNGRREFFNRNNRLEVRDRTRLASRRIAENQRHTEREEINENDFDESRRESEGRRSSRSRIAEESEERKFDRKLANAREDSRNARNEYRAERALYHSQGNFFKNRRGSQEQGAWLAGRSRRGFHNDDSIIRRQVNSREIYETDRRSDVETRRGAQVRRNEVDRLQPRRTFNKRAISDRNNELNSLRRILHEERNFENRANRGISEPREMHGQLNELRETDDLMARIRVDSRQAGRREKMADSRRNEQERRESLRNIYSRDELRRQDRAERFEPQQSRIQRRESMSRQVRESQRLSSQGPEQRDTLRGTTEEFNSRDADRQRESRMRKNENTYRELRERTSLRREDNERHMVRRQGRERFEQNRDFSEREMGLRRQELNTDKNRRDSGSDIQSERRTDSKDHRNRIEMRRTVSLRKVSNRDSRDREESDRYTSSAKIISRREYADRRDINDSGERREREGLIADSRRQSNERRINRNILDRRNSRTQVESRRESGIELITRNHRDSSLDEIRGSRDARDHMNRLERFEVFGFEKRQEVRREATNRDVIRSDHTRTERSKRNTREHERITERDLNARSSVKNSRRTDAEPIFKRVESNRLTKDSDSDSFYRKKSYSADYGAYFYLLQAILLASAVASIIKQGDAINEKKLRNNWLSTKLAALQPVF